MSVTTPPTADGAGRGLLDRLTGRQMILAVILLGLALYVPFAGSYGLHDPWETHYGEVARQMRTRGDVISLWWPGSPIDADHFWSKPVFSFWVMAASMKLAGVAAPGAPSGELALSSRIEWAMRVPFCLFGVLGMLGIYLMVSRFVSRRAGVLAAAILGTMPMYGLVSRQAMTDMAFIGPMIMALALGAMALFEDDDRELPRRTLGRWSYPHHPLFYGALALLAATGGWQLVADSIQLTWTWHPKSIQGVAAASPLLLAGIGVGVAGWRTRWREPFVLAGAIVVAATAVWLGLRQGRTLPGVALMVPYIIGFVAFVLLAARTRYKAPLYLYMAAMLCGVSILAKGIAGLGLPVLIFVAYLAFTWSWKRLDRAQLYFGILVAVLACAVVAVPWHEAMLARHGTGFWDELYGDNHWRRLVMGRHGDRGSFEYFLRELGYSVLPWLALAPAALLAVAQRLWRRRGAAAGVDDPAEARRQQVFWFGAIWFVVGYALVSFSVTKFHHYILPALPGLAIALGCFLDDAVERQRARALLAVAMVGVPLLGLVLLDLIGAINGPQHFIWLFSYDYINAPKGRTWPTGLSFAPALITFVILFALSTLTLGWKRLQRWGLVALMLCAVGFNYWLLDRFMPKISYHWSQKPLVATYYKMRSSPAERLVAWQMYWRGENFYTANEIYDGPKEERTVFLGDKNAENLKAWVAKHRGERQFFIIERSRLDSLKSLLPAEVRPSVKIVDEANTKFCLLQAQL